MSLPALAAAIVHALRNSMGDSAHNQATMVQGMIQEAMDSVRVVDPENHPIMENVKFVPSPESEQLKYMREWGSRCQDEMQKQAAAAMELRDLIHHGYIHSTYRDFGFMQMTTPQKKLFIALLNERDHKAAAERLSGFIAEDDDE